jgi:hypothetical protein
VVVVGCGVDDSVEDFFVWRPLHDTMAVLCASIEMCDPPIVDSVLP